jgi:hypothetical protein
MRIARFAEAGERYAPSPIAASFVGLSTDSALGRVLSSIRIFQWMATATNPAPTNVSLAGISSKKIHTHSGAIGISAEASRRLGRWQPPRAHHVDPEPPPCVMIPNRPSSKMSPVGMAKGSAKKNAKAAATATTRPRSAQPGCARLLRRGRLRVAAQCGPTGAFGLCRQTAWGWETAVFLSKPAANGHSS